jgi:hypothetical protein
MMIRNLHRLQMTALLVIMASAPAASADPQAYALTGSFNMIAGATGNIVGYPTDPRLLPVMTPVSEYTSGMAGTLTVDFATGEFAILSVDIANTSFTLDATWHIGGLPAPPHGTLTVSNMAHTASGGEIGTPTPGQIDYPSGVNFDQAGGTTSCSSPFGALFCLNDSIGPFFDVNTGEIFPIGQSSAFTIDEMPDDSIELTIVFDSGIVTGDAQAVQTMTLVGTPASAAPGMAPIGLALLVAAIASGGLGRLRS